jgi:hypothetical protein
MKMKRLILAALWIGLISACATMGDVMQSKDQGTSQIYPVTFDQAWTIAKTVFRWEGADAIEEHKDERYMLTSSGMDLATVGSVMGAWIDPMPDGQMKVTVVTKRRVQTNVFTTLTETTFHKRFGQAVEIVKSGKALPPKPPEQ